MFALILLACQPQGELQIDPLDPSDPIPTVVPTAPDPSEPPVDFTPGALIEVEVTMPTVDFESLRNETRNAFELLSDDCLAEPFGSPFTWYEADVTLDGRPVEQVGIRKKGFLGSLDEERPSLKLKLDKFVDGQTLGGTERVTLNNQRVDPGRLRNCLGFQVFEAAGVPTPRCNFAHVQVNGEDLGVYVHIEAVKRDFLERAFGESDGDLYEGTLSDFRTGWTGTFAPKTSSTDPTGAPLQALATALESPDDQLLDALEPVLDLDHFIRFWAAEVLTAHWDGYAMNTNNYYVYFGSDGRARFIPWGADAVMYELGEPFPSMPILLSGELNRRLYAMPSTRASFRTELQRQLDEVFDEASLHDSIDTWQATLGPAVLDRDAFDDDVDVLRAWVDRHDGWLQATLDDLPPPITEPSSPLCFVSLGTASWSFDTTFSLDFSEVSFGDPVELVLDGIDYSFADTYTLSGFGDEGGPVVTTIGDPGSGMIGQIILGTTLDRFTPGVLPIDFVNTIGVVVLADAITEEVLFEGFIGGEVVLDAASTDDGAPVSGTMVGSIYSL